MVEEANNSEVAWHALAETEVFELLDVDPELGLSSEEVRRRQREYGANRLSAKGGVPSWKRFLRQFHQPLVYILLVAAAVTLALGEHVDSIVIFAVVFINAIIGFLQEDSAEKAIRALAESVVTEATVRRDGQKKRVAAEELVPGDIVILQSGDKAPADLRLFQNRSLQVDESALTGESLPVSKRTDPVALNSLLAERENLGYAGTLVTHGQAEGVVWAIGDQTETGRIARLIGGTVDLSTPLTRKIDQFSKLLLWVIIGLAGLTFAIGTIRGDNLVEIFMASVALAVGAIPEGLPAAVTITLAIGVYRMAQRRAIIRRLPAVETLGGATVICSDKTGTLTENQMTVQEVFAGGRVYSVTGAGYAPEGEVTESAGVQVDLERHEALRECLLAGLLCNDSQLVFEEGVWDAQGDPTEVALIVSAAKAGLRDAHEVHHLGRIDSIPFESEHQFMATLHSHAEREHRVIYKKGALEKLLDRSHDMIREDGSVGPMDREAIMQAAHDMAGRGMRVLCLVRRVADSGQETLDHHHVSGQLTFIGLQGMIDPPRKEAIESVAKCKEAGVQVKMITGDHVITAKAIARQLGLESTNADKELIAISAQELDQVSSDELPEFAERVSVFARVAPEQKLKLVRALQERGHVVAMTGDGVNDAPALKQADIGVAMGRSGTEVAKGAADMLLTDDNFSSIEAAIEEGRGVFDNLTKFIVWTLPTNMGEGLIILAAILMGAALPVLPVHLLWINMSTAILLGLTLVFEAKEEDIMRRRPRDPKAPILTKPLMQRIGLVSLIMLIGAFGLFLLEYRFYEKDLAFARTVALNVIVAVEAAYLFNCRSLTHSMFHVGLFSNKWVLSGLASMIAAQAMITYIPFANKILHTAPIGWIEWGRILIVAAVAYFAVELEKGFRRRMRSRNRGERSKGASS